MIRFLVVRCHYTWQAAVRIPLAQVWALWCVDSEAQGMKPTGPRYGERERIDALNCAEIDRQEYAQKLGIKKRDHGRQHLHRTH